MEIMGAPRLCSFVSFINFQIGEIAVSSLKWAK